MSSRYLIVALLAVVWCIPATAQHNKDSFEEYRKFLLNDYSSFQKNIVDDYDKFLDGVWKEYEIFRGENQLLLPKPKYAPKPNNNHPTIPTVVKNPTPFVQEPTEPNQKPITHIKPTTPKRECDILNYYCLSASIPKIDITHEKTFYESKSFADLWRYYVKSEIAESLVPAIYGFCQEKRLPDWFTFDFVNTYVEKLYPHCGSKMQISFKHYLLLNLGYDVKIGTSMSNVPILLVNFAQMVYARPYLNVNGIRYFVFYNNQDRDNASVSSSLSIKTYETPLNTSSVNPMDLIIRESMNLPYKPYHYSWKHNGFEICGEFNENIIPMLYHYPQIPYGCYLQSSICQDVRNQVIEQFKVLLANKDQRQAVNTLLQFIQFAFDYATDDEQYGFEKPYFFEETLYYPKCDCEDRAMFFSYLLHHVLDVENQLISYPRHVSVAVHLETPINGVRYTYDGVDFYISDPTYIGAVTGMCMPNYQNEQPKIEYYYKPQ